MKLNTYRQGGEPEAGDTATTSVTCRNCMNSAPLGARSCSNTQTQLGIPDQLAVAGWPALLSRVLVHSY